MSMSLVKLANKQLLGYFERFRTKLKTVHMVHLKRLILFLRALESDMSAQLKEASQAKEKVLSVTTFVEAMGSKVNGINFLEINDYLLKSKVQKKSSVRLIKKLLLIHICLSNRSLER
jgi:chromosome transmission fidelity protein 1